MILLLLKIFAVLVLAGGGFVAFGILGAEVILGAAAAILLGFWIERTA
jgi:hypothetical protein